MPTYTICFENHNFLNMNIYCPLHSFFIYNIFYCTEFQKNFHCPKVKKKYISLKQMDFSLEFKEALCYVMLFCCLLLLLIEHNFCSWREWYVSQLPMDPKVAQSTLDLYAGFKIDKLLYFLKFIATKSELQLIKFN